MQTLISGQILVFGMHRSGTSMTTRLINMLGAYFGASSIQGAHTADNPKGFWERPETLAINDALLKQRGCSWSDVRALHAPVLAPTPELARQMQTLIAQMDAHAPWVLKDPRLCLTFAQWKPFFGAPIAVIVHRNPLEIAVSLQKRNGFSLAYGVALWEHYAVHLLNATRALPRIYMHYADMQERPLKACEYLHDRLAALGISSLRMPPEGAIEDFIDASLYRSKPAPGITLSPEQQSLVEYLRGAKAQPELLTVSSASTRAATQ